MMKKTPRCCIVLAIFAYATLVGGQYDYEVGQINTVCQLPYEGVPDASTCDDFASILGTNFGGTDTLSYAPRGCILWNGGNLIWNQHDVGAPDAFYQPICVLPSPTSPPTPAPPTHNPTLSGDPHLVGFLGQLFDLIGRPQSLYRFVDDDRLRMSVLIDTPAFEHSSDATLRASARHAGLFMLGVDLAFLDNDGEVIEVSVRADFNSTIHHDPRYCGPNAGETGCLRGLQAQVNGGSPISHVMGEMRLGQDAALTSFNTGCNFNKRAGCTSKAANGGNAVFSLTTPSIDVDVGAVLMNNHHLMEKNLHHLDLDVSKYRPSGNPGGLLGQTVEYQLDKDGQPITKGAASIEGVEDDYIIPQPRVFKLKNTPFNAGRSFAASVDGDKVV